jgi:hypothetical protein
MYLKTYKRCSYWKPNWVFRIIPYIYLCSSHFVRHIILCAKNKTNIRPFELVNKGRLNFIYLYLCVYICRYICSWVHIWTAHTQPTKNKIPYFYTNFIANLQTFFNRPQLSQRSSESVFFEQKCSAPHSLAWLRQKSQVKDCRALSKKWFVYFFKSNLNVLLKLYAVITAIGYFCFRLSMYVLCRFMWCPMYKCRHLHVQLVELSMVFNEPNIYPMKFRWK